MKPTVFIPEDQRRLMMLVEMDGITTEQQQQLYALALDGQSEETIALYESLQKNGATFRYSKQDVDRILGKREHFVVRFAKWLTD